MPNKKINIAAILNDFFIITCLISFFGAVVYRLYSLNSIGAAANLVLAAIAFIFLLRLKRISRIENREIYCDAGEWQEKNRDAENRGFILWTAVYCLLAAACFLILFKSQTAEAVVSPWQTVPAYFFALYAAATGLIFYLAAQAGNSRRENAVIFLISLHYFLSFSAVWIIYKLGYGYDSFVHQATMDLIDKTGAVEPKPFYYLGYYALIAIIHKITSLPIFWLDKLIVPVLAAVFLPMSLYRALSEWYDDKTAALALILILLILPFPFFISSAPQNFAYLLLLITVIRGLTCACAHDLIIIYLFALAALAVHPIAGIPALLLALALTVFHSDKTNWKKYFYGLIFIFSAVILPAAFYFVEKSNSPVQSATAAAQTAAIAWPKLIMPGEENFILNFIYLYGFNVKFFAALLAAAGIAIALKHGRKCKIFFLYLLIAAGLAASYFAVKILPFNYLIDYERGDYSGRILLAAAFLLLPFILAPLYGLTKKILTQSAAIKYPLIVFLSLLAAASLYLSYPRLDNYFNSHGYAVSDNDLEAVRWIESDGQSDFIVLANQQVSAAALREFGFKKYFKTSDSGGINSEIFYYPVPTGGRLYQYYLGMVYDKPSRASMFKAMDLAGVDKGYFVLNDYWWAFPKILAEAKLEADSWREINGGKIYIFKYEK